MEQSTGQMIGGLYFVYKMPMVRQGRAKKVTPIVVDICRYVNAI